MPIDIQYGKRTGVTSMKAQVKELCETFFKYQVFIVAWVNTNSVDPNKSLILALISSVNAACAAVAALPDD